MIKIKVVYFCYLIPEDWSVLREQIIYLKKTGLYQSAHELYINCIVSKDKETKFRDFINEHANRFIIYNVTDENTYEYTGIKCLHETAESESISLYFHSKGISNKNSQNDTCRQFLMYELCDKKILNIFNTYKDIEKITCFPSTEGWCWYNFFWVRGDFLLTKEAPIKTPSRRDGRWYYEMWSKGDPSKNYSVIKKNKIFTAYEANYFISRL